MGETVDNSLVTALNLDPAKFMEALMSDAQGEFHRQLALFQEELDQYNENKSSNEKTSVRNIMAEWRRDIPIDPNAQSVIETARQAILDILVDNPEVIVHVLDQLDLVKSELADYRDGVIANANPETTDEIDREWLSNRKGLIRMIMNFAGPMGFMRVSTDKPFSTQNPGYFDEDKGEWTKLPNLPRGYDASPKSTPTTSQLQLSVNDSEPMSLMEATQRVNAVLRNEDPSAQSYSPKNLLAELSKYEEVDSLTKPFEVKFKGIAIKGYQS